MVLGFQKGYLKYRWRSYFRPIHRRLPTELHDEGYGLDPDHRRCGFYAAPPQPHDQLRGARLLDRARALGAFLALELWGQPLLFVGQTEPYINRLSRSLFQMENALRLEFCNFERPYGVWQHP